MSAPLPWMTMYPTVAAVNEAAWQTLHAWHEHLPKPDNDVQRTVIKKINARLNAGLVPELKKHSPELADSYQNLMNKLNAIFDTAKKNQ